MRLKAILIVTCILLSLLPAYALLEYFKKLFRPRESGARFAGWLLCTMVFIFVYTFIVSFIIRVVFPRA